MNVHFLLVPHRYLKHMDPSILQDEIAVYHHGNHIITSYFPVTYTLPLLLWTGPKDCVPKNIEKIVTWQGKLAVDL